MPGDGIRTIGIGHAPNMTTAAMRLKAMDRSDPTPDPRGALIRSCRQWLNFESGASKARDGLDCRFGG
jgi:hypothetical protein